MSTVPVVVLHKRIGIESVAAKARTRDRCPMSHLFQKLAPLTFNFFFLVCMFVWKSCILCW